jgi:hypothetical protein
LSRQKRSRNYPRLSIEDNDQSAELKLPLTPQSPGISLSRVIVAFYDISRGMNTFCPSAVKNDEA